MKNLSSNDIWICSKDNPYYNSLEERLLFTNQFSSEYNGYANKDYRDKIVVVRNKALVNGNKTNIDTPLDYVNYGTRDEVCYYEQDKHILQLAFNHDLDYAILAVYKIETHIVYEFEFKTEIILRDSQNLREVFKKEIRCYNPDTIVKRMYKIYEEFA
jgi:hypothetical protein